MIHLILFSLLMVLVMMRSKIPELSLVILLLLLGIWL